MPGNIYVIHSDNILQALSEQTYPQEEHLQDSLAQFPDLLAVDQMNEAQPLSSEVEAWERIVSCRALYYLGG